MSISANEPFMSYQSAQAEAAEHQDMHQHDAWGNYEARPRIHRARLEDAGSLLAYRQASAIDLYNIIDGRSSTFILARGNRDQGDLYEERRLHPDSGSFGEDITAFLPKQPATGYLHKGPLEESLLFRSARGSGPLPIEYGMKKDAVVNESSSPPRSAHAGSEDLYGVAGESRRPKMARQEKGITKHGGKEQDPETHTALALATDSNQQTSAGGAPSHSSPVAATGLPQENLKGAGFPQTERGSIRPAENGSLNEPPQQIRSSTKQSGKTIEAVHQDVPVPLLSTVIQPSDAGSFVLPPLFAETAGSLLTGFPVSLSGPLVLRDPYGSASSAEEGPTSQTSSTPVLSPEPDGDVMHADHAQGEIPGPAAAAADPASAKTDTRGTLSSVLQTYDVLKDGQREGSGRVFPFLAASRESATGQNKIYRGVPTPRLDSVTGEDRDVSESGRRWWGKDHYAR